MTNERCNTCGLPSESAIVHMCIPALLAEIERLTQHYAAETKLHLEAESEHAATVIGLKDEIDRLKEALTKIARFADPGLDGVNATWMRGYAKAALKGTPEPTANGWQSVESFDFEQGFATTRWVLVYTSDGRVTEGLPFIMNGGKRVWICACGNNAHDPRYIPSPSALRDTITHWMPKPEPPVTPSR